MSRYQKLSNLRLMAARGDYRGDPWYGWVRDRSSAGGGRRCRSHGHDLGFPFAYRHAGTGAPHVHRLGDP